MKIKRIEHIAIAVKSMAQSREIFASDTKYTNMPEAKPVAGQ